MTLSKETILKAIDKRKFYQERIKSLQINDKPDVLGLCPFHDDHNPSLSVNLETGLYRCFACDAKGDLFTFYQDWKGVDFPTALKELAVIAGVREINSTTVATFNYTDEGGNILYRKKRIEPCRNGKPKEFVFEHLKDGKWALRRGGKAVLYRQNELIGAEYCFIPEGEAKADLLASWELTATCLDSGANSKLTKEHVEVLSKIKRIFILPDNDEPGKGYALRFADALAGKVQKLKIVQLPTPEAGGDIIDWARTPGNDKKKFLEIVQNAPEGIPFEVEGLKRKKKSSATNVSSISIVGCTDTGNAERLVVKYGSKIKYCHAWEKWLIYNGKQWVIDDSGQIIQFAKATAKAIFNEAANAGDYETAKELSKWALKSQHRERLLAMVKLAESEPGVPISPGEMDADPMLLNCENGTLNLRAAILQPHDPADFITKIIRVRYEPEAMREKWIEFLEDIFNWDQNLVGFIQRAIGYSLTGDTSEQCVFILYGSGANGKSTFINIVSELLGDFAQTADFSSFIVRKHEGVRNDLARMCGKRFISAVESEGEGRLSEVIVKQLTGGDIIKARYLFAEFFEFKPTFKLWLTTNHKPNIRGTDHGIWRRIRLIPFNKTFSPEQQDKQLLQKLRMELPGILAWAVQGCLEWQKKGLQPPEAVTTATENYRGEMDVIGLFIQECCFVSDDSSVKVASSDLYDAYRKWCEQNGEHPIDNRKFGIRITEKGFGMKQSGGTRWRLGLGLHT